MNRKGMGNEGSKEGEYGFILSLHVWRWNTETCRNNQKDGTKVERRIIGWWHNLRYNSHIQGNVTNPLSNYHK
jgi:hypothetical protein